MPKRRNGQSIKRRSIKKQLTRRVCVSARLCLRDKMQWNALTGKCKFQRSVNLSKLRFASERNWTKLTLSRAATVLPTGTPAPVNGGSVDGAPAPLVPFFTPSFSPAVMVHLQRSGPHSLPPLYRPLGCSVPQGEKGWRLGRKKQAVPPHHHIR